MVRPSFSLEFSPPRDSEGEERLWSALTSLSQIEPDFVSVTCGAGGSARDRTVKVTGEITKRTGIPTVAHLTCVGATKLELESILDSHRLSGIKYILALRGDPEGEPSAEWTPTPGGFDHSDELVSLAHQKNFEEGVAAFPDGHPASSSFQKDVDVLLEKERRGATFSATQSFFTKSKYQKPQDALKAAGSKRSLIAGILPITNFKQLNRMAQLSGAEVPNFIVEQLKSVSDQPERVKELGIDIAAKLGSELMEIGAPGLHFNTMNSATSATEIVKKIGLR